MINGNGSNEISSRVSIIRNDGAAVNHLPMSHSVRDQSLFIANDYSFKLVFENAPMDFQFYMNDLPVDESIIYELEGLDMNSFFYYSRGENNGNGIPVVNSMAQLESSTTSAIFKNTNNGTMFLKLVPEMRHGFPFPQAKKTYQNKLMGGVMINVSIDNTLSTDDLTFDSNEITLYPNPVLDTFTLKTNNTEELKAIEIISINGSVVKQFAYHKDCLLYTSDAADD